VSLDEWRRLTPRTLLRLQRRERDRERRMDARFGLLASLIHAPNREKGSRVKGALEWFEGPKKETPEEAIAVIHNIQAYIAAKGKPRVSA